MAEGIQIPSPSAILGPSPPNIADALPTPAAVRAARRTSSAAGLDSGTKRQKAQKPAPPKGCGVDKPKQSKSRNGCQTCKAKRLKCDEEKPGCRNCEKRGVPCGGYKKDFKWRPFEETNVKLNIDRQNQGHGQHHHHHRAKSRSVDASAEASGQTTPTNEYPPLAGLEFGGHAGVRGKLDSVIAGAEVSAFAHPSKRPSLARRATDSPVVLMASMSPSDTMRPSDLTNRAMSAATPDVVAAVTMPESLEPGRPMQTSQIPVSSPTLTDILAPFSAIQSPHGEMEFMSFPSPRATLEADIAEARRLDDDNDEEALQNFHPPQTLPSMGPARSHRTSVSESLSTLDLAVRPRGMDIHSPPHESDTSTDALVWRFLHVTSPILSVMDGPTENPWRTLIWPLAQKSPALFNAIIALAAFHAAFKMPQMRVIGQEHKQASLQYLQQRLQSNDMRDEIAIATALALGFAEAWDQQTVSGNTHIKGAQVLVKRALAQHRHRPRQGDDLKLLKFLCNAWVYMDVIARLTAVDNDESNDFDDALFLPEPPNMIMSDDGFGIDFGMPIDARLDPFMGCANTLFPLIGRVGNLVRRVCRSVNNSLSVISQARDLRRALEEWDPPAVVDEPEDPTTDIEHTVQTAEAYRWATLLHLHQSVPELPSPSSAELAHLVLQFLATIPPESRTINVHIYPLLVAGCEAGREEDRQWVRGRWKRMSERMRLGTLENAAIVTEEVWRRRDLYEAQPTARRKLVATAELQPVRRNGRPLARDDSGSFGGDPGGTGVVFSYVADGSASVEGNSPDAGGSTAAAPTTGPSVPPSGSNKAIGMLGDPQKRNTAEKQRGQPRPRYERHMDPAYTVRGHLHWVGVMWDWGWEILLG